MRADTRGSEILLVALMFVTWGVVFLDRMALLYLVPYIAPDLHLNSAQVGALAGVISLSWAVSALVFGAVSDRFGRKAVLLPMVVMFSLLSISSGLVHSFAQLLAARALLGIAEGPCWSVIMALVEERSDPVHRGRNIGIVVSAAAIIGLAIAPVLTTQIAAHVGWRWAFYVAGAPGLLMALLIALLVSDSHEPHGSPAGHRLSLSDVLSLMRYRNIWVCALSAAGYMTWLFLINAFGPLYITMVERQSGTTAGFLMGAAGLGSFLLGLIGPALSDRYGRRPIWAAQGLLCILLPLALLIHPLYNYLWALATLLFLTQGGQAITAICVVLVPTESVPRNLAASAIGFVTLFGELLGGFAAPIVAGSLAAQHGLATALWMAAGGSAVVLLASLLASSRGLATGQREVGAFGILYAED